MSTTTSYIFVVRSRPYIFTDTFYKFAVRPYIFTAKPYIYLLLDLIYSQLHPIYLHSVLYILDDFCPLRRGTRRQLTQLNLGK